MTEEQNALFEKARRALKTARVNLDADDPEAAANRAYYRRTIQQQPLCWKWVKRREHTEEPTIDFTCTTWLQSGCQDIPASSWTGLSKLANEQTTKPSASLTGWPRRI